MNQENLVIVDRRQVNQIIELEGLNVVLNLSKSQIAKI